MEVCLGRCFMCTQFQVRSIYEGKVSRNMHEHGLINRNISVCTHFSDFVPTPTSSRITVHSLIHEHPALSNSVRMQRGTRCSALSCHLWYYICTRIFPWIHRTHNCCQSCFKFSTTAPPWIPTCCQHTENHHRLTFKVLCEHKSLWSYHE